MGVQFWMEGRNYLMLEYHKRKGSGDSGLCPPTKIMLFWRATKGLELAEITVFRGGIVRNRCTLLQNGPKLGPEMLS